MDFGRLSEETGLQIPIVSRIADSSSKDLLGSVFHVSKNLMCDSGFHRKKLPGNGIRVTLNGATSKYNGFQDKFTEKKMFNSHSSDSDQNCLPPSIG